MSSYSPYRLLMSLPVANPLIDPAYMTMGKTALVNRNMCQWRTKMSHFWRMDMSHSAWGGEPYNARASFAFLRDPSDELSSELAFSDCPRSPW
jgi:hypothetical protein